jgi:hypothetical protein
MSSLAIRDVPQSGGSPPESINKCYSEDGGYSRNSIVILGSELSCTAVDQLKANPPPYDRTTDNAITSVKSLIILIVLAVTKGRNQSYRSPDPPTW